MVLVGLRFSSGKRLIAFFGVEKTREIERLVCRVSEISIYPLRMRCFRRVGLSG